MRESCGWSHRFFGVISKSSLAAMDHRRLEIESQAGATAMGHTI